MVKKKLQSGKEERLTFNILAWPQNGYQMNSNPPNIAHIVSFFSILPIFFYQIWLGEWVRFLLNFPRFCITNDAEQKKIMYFLPSVKRLFLVFWLVAECRLPVHKQRCLLILSGKQMCLLSLSYSCPFVCSPIRAYAHQNHPSRIMILQAVYLRSCGGWWSFFSVNKQLTEH